MAPNMSNRQFSHNVENKVGLQSLGARGISSCNRKTFRHFMSFIRSHLRLLSFQIQNDDLLPSTSSISEELQGYHWAYIAPATLNFEGAHVILCCCSLEVCTPWWVRTPVVRVRYCPTPTCPQPRPPTPRATTCSSTPPPAPASTPAFSSLPCPHPGMVVTLTCSVGGSSPHHP